MVNWWILEKSCYLVVVSSGNVEVVWNHVGWVNYVVDMYKMKSVVKYWFVMKCGLFMWNIGLMSWNGFSVLTLIWMLFDLNVIENYISRDLKEN